MDQITITLQATTALMVVIPSFIAALTGLCATIAAYLPPPAQNATHAYMVTYRVINWLGRNVGHAENKQ